MQITDPVFKKLETLSEQINQKFKKQGIVIPFRNDDGSVVIGKFTITKKGNQYQILNKYGETVLSNINLPQTAAIIANDLELGKLVNQAIVYADSQYGFAEFEEILYRNRISNKKNAETYWLKSKTKQERKEYFRRTVISHFEKLIKFA